MLLRGIVRSGKKRLQHLASKAGAVLHDQDRDDALPRHPEHPLIDQTFPTPADPVRLEAHEYGGRVSVSIVPCRIFGSKAFILRPDTNRGKHGDPPASILKVATDVKLRDVYGLSDGDVVEVEVDVEPHAHSAPITQRGLRYGCRRPRVRGAGNSRRWFR